MKKCKKIKWILVFNCVFFQLMVQTYVQAQEKLISLGNSTVKLKNNNFYLLKIIDERSDKLRVGLVYNEEKDDVYLNVVNGVTKASNEFLTKFTRKNASAYPIIIKIKELKVVEKIVNAKIINGHSEIKVAFGFLRDTTLIDLTSFQTKITFTRSFNADNHFEYLIGRLLDKSMIYFDQWMTINYDKNPALAKSLKINLQADYGVDNPVSGDTVFWSPKHKLSWQDFEGKRPQNTKYAAQVFTNFEYGAFTDIKDGVLIIDLQLKAYLLKSSSWTMGMLTEYSLAHEQLHFDITKAIIERFKKKATKILTLDNYDSELQLLFIEMYREFNRLQKEYDADSNHSINFVGQQKWQSLISEELREIR
ncbi:hypothetical protein VB264_16035 [Arcicella aquatica]|uniref:DUF922 domain-containing protein n=1 Tax=Arcicella aquatica TaxID=217141 RepID=A0ABU5QQL5_9BACT|nr:hypothetical protein [Arcicella aquatica]MEA5259308.1 hypothetical protein [Arcicella aquatica]